LFHSLSLATDFFQTDHVRQPTGDTANAGLNIAIQNSALVINSFPVSSQFDNGAGTATTWRQADRAYVTASDCKGITSPNPAQDAETQQAARRPAR
jgi:hypothetical protein